MTEPAEPLAVARPMLMVTNMFPSRSDPVFGTFVKGQVAGLREIGADVRVVANADRRTGPFRTPLKYASLGVRALVAAMRGADVVVGHYLYPTAAIAVAAARVARCRCVLVAHGSDVDSVQRAGAIARACVRATRRASLVVCVSRALEGRVREELALPEGVATAVVHMGVDLDVFSPRPEARSALGWDERDRVAVSVANLVPGKGLDVGLDAFARLAADGACDRYVIVGEGPAEAELRARCEAAGVGDRVTFTGKLPGPEVAMHVSAADVLVLPSRAEGLGIVLLEAMACGTPCVASSVGGVPEVLRAPECGRLVPPDDPAALAAGIAEVLAEGRASFSAACIAAAASQGTQAQAARFAEAVGSVVRGKY